jgi:DNA-binding response OmpR family regulator
MTGRSSLKVNPNKEAPLLFYSDLYKTGTMEKAVLVIEDDVSILRGLKDNLTFEGYRVTTLSDGEEGLRVALDEDFDLLLLDLMLPGMNGYEICRKLKREKPELPVIMITARGTEMDKIAGLDIGADDYLTKPFSIPELLARIRAVLRRSGKGQEEPDQFNFGHVKLDFRKMKAFFDDSEINLSGKEYAIMKYLILHKGEVVQRDELLEAVWGHDVIPDTRTVDNFILDLRKKLEEVPSDPRHIITVRGAGYKFLP